MKKAFSLLMVIILSIVMFSCSGLSTKGIKIQRFEEELSSGNWAFSVEEEGNGYSFDHSENSTVTNIQISGKADKNKNVKTITITNKDIDTSYFSDYSKFENVFSKSAGQMTVADVRVLFCVTQLWSLEKAIDPSFKVEDSTLKDEIMKVHSFFKGNSIQLKGWTIKSTVDSSGSVVITASK